MNTANATIQACIELGYDGIAINHLFQPSDISHISTRPFFSLSDWITKYRQLLSGDNFLILHRLTFYINEIEDLKYLEEDNLSPLSNVYDIIALQPADESTLEACLDWPHASIVSITFTNYHSAIEKIQDTKKLLEISFAPSLQDKTEKFKFLKLMDDLMKITKCKNLIITSQAKTPLQLRPPLDYLNMAYVINGKSNDSINLIGKNVMTLVYEVSNLNMLVPLTQIRESNSKIGPPLKELFLLDRFLHTKMIK
jgi:ribonuclease P/MRP protein subunit RPP1